MWYCFFERRITFYECLLYDILVDRVNEKISSQQHAHVFRGRNNFHADLYNNEQNRRQSRVIQGKREKNDTSEKPPHKVSSTNARRLKAHGLRASSVHAGQLSPL